MVRCKSCGKDYPRLLRSGRCSLCEKKRETIIKKIRKFEFWALVVNDKQLREHSLAGLESDLKACEFYEKTSWARSELKNKSGSA